MHESGHILGGIIGDVISGNQIQNYTFSNWIRSPFPGLMMPQQTHNSGNASIFFILGGMYAEIIFSLFFCLLIYARFNFKNKIWIFSIPVFTAIRQFLSNFLCGTDNPFNHPYAICQENSLTSFLLRWFDYSIILILFILIFPIIFKELPYVKDKIQHFLGRKAEFL
ncbi:MAG: hypothetical protein M0Q91_11340 [Methanoregula sp.]|nr:hypothetical protein [Methanoregula sp.]